MINNWWVTRPKRKLNYIPEILVIFSEYSLNQVWLGKREAHLRLEKALEDFGIKRKGERRDQTGGGARTYQAWLASLGLVFIHEATNLLKLTLAGEAIITGDSPVVILKEQVLKYQFPSSYSLGRNIKVSPRFKIRPFRFILKLLNDKRINCLSKEEIAKVIIVEAESENQKCYESVVEKILLYRENGDKCLDKDFFNKYPPSKGVVNKENPFGNLRDIANTIVNWVEYTQLAKRDADDRKLRIIPEKISEVKYILANEPSFIDRPEQQEYYQRKYGLDPKHKKDTRNLAETKTITAKIIDEHKVKQIFLNESLKTPIGKITTELIDIISEKTGIDGSFVEDVLKRNYQYGAIGSFMTEYFEMAFKGRDEAMEFEKATVEIFKTIMGFEAIHTGPIGLTPDILILSDKEQFCGIIDNKAYSKYSITNDHHNRMVTNYIKGLGNYYTGKLPLGFFSYIAGGFGQNINSQIKNISNLTSVHGSAITVSNMISIVENYKVKDYDHEDIKRILSLDRLVLLDDLK
jgi:hypothetical protein